MDYSTTWAEMEKQNMEYLGETWNTTADKVALEGEDTYYNKLNKYLQQWVTIHMDNQTDLYMGIQAVTINIKQMEEQYYMDSHPNRGIKPTKQEIGWVWHLLHQEP